MRILFIAGEYPPLQGGLGDYTRELARALVAAGHEPHVLTRAVPGAPREESTFGIHVQRSMQRWGWSTLGQVNAAIRAIRPDVVNLQYQAAAYNMHGAINLLPRVLARQACPVPVVVTFHDLRVPYLFPKAGPLRWRAIREMAHRSTATIVTNVEDRATLEQARIKHLYLIPIGSNITPATLEDFDRAAWLRNHSIPPGASLVGYFGFMNESKGGETLVRALAELVAQHTDALLLLIGGQTGASDPTNVAYARVIDQVAGELGVRERIRHTGYLDECGVSEALAMCNCVALPYRDGASFRRGTLMAALAHGCAIVTTTPRLTIAELQDEQNVLLAPTGDAHRLAGAILRVLCDAPLRQRLQAGSLQLSAQFGWDRIAAETVSVFQSLQR